MIRNGNEPQRLHSSTLVIHQESSITANLLALAYERPCFVCAKQGACPHREWQVELALIIAAGRKLPVSEHRVAQRMGGAA